MNSALENDGLTLPGYELVTKLGAGGYGEVWLARAPGGLTKAVKFVFGSYHEKRAEHELRALERVKEVRHPFLLSLERIEVVGGRLVIVTELAEGSLKDRFDECRRQGLPGIPRPELLAYLSDAADALDFLSQKHSLQHLDVKPENLLLVAGHVKVADFGLVKDISSTQASLVGGLTPLYSAPEVFQGCPSTHSDQYSLAVLYQEMLTGVPCFSGVTAAELTLQHLHDEPDLSALPASDRYVLARALAKEASHRFESTREMIAGLMSAAGGDAQWTQAADDAATPPAKSSDSAFEPAPLAPLPRRATEIFDEKLEERRETSTSLMIDLDPPFNPEQKELPPLALAAEQFRAQPTLIIGVGGVAASVLKQFRQRLARQFGEEKPSAIQMLLLDSDPKTIARATQGEPRSALKPDETLALPLRRPHEYREQSSRLTRWLSRRWLYNVPRSLRTEGMRPLGRLAFADHCRQAVQRIRMSLAHAADAEALNQSHQQTGLTFDGSRPRVYLVASISGGAGSGMALDIAMAARTVLEKMGAGDAKIIGVFLHATGRDPRHCDLARVNAFSWLTEYNHFHRAGSQFPGDDSCGLPPLPVGKRAIDSAYLVDINLNGADDVAEPASRSIAEYIYLDALTPAQQFFDACRDDQDASPPGAPLRSFHLNIVQAASDQELDIAAAQLSREVVLGWVGGDAGSAIAADRPAAASSAGQSVRETNQLVQGAAKLVGQLQLKLEGLASNARSLVEAQFGGDHRSFLQSMLEPAGGAKPTPAAEALATLDRLFTAPAGDDATLHIFDRPIDAIISPLAMRLGGDLARWVLQKLDNRQERLAGARGAADWLVDHLKRVESDASRLADALAKQAAAYAEETRRATRGDDRIETTMERATAYFRIRIDHAAVTASLLIARRLLAELKNIGATISELARHLKHVASMLSVAQADSSQNPSLDVDESGSTPPLLSALERRCSELTEAIDSQLQTEFIEVQGGLFQTIMGNARIRAQMLAALNKLARRAAEQLAVEPEVLSAAFSNHDPTVDAAVNEHATPAHLEFGGVYRQLSVVPSACVVSDSLSAAAKTTRLALPGNDAVTVCEAWRLPLVHVAMGLIRRRRDYADFAARVNTRSDIPWTPLFSPAARMPLSVADDPLAPPLATQML